MSAGKAYLNTSAFSPGGIPASLNVYCNEDATKMSLTVTDIVDGEGVRQPAFVMSVPVFHDTGGPFILAPVDPSEITGLSDLVQ